MSFVPVFLNVASQPVLVVGGGQVAARKIRPLLNAGARVRVVAQALGERLAEWVDQGKVEWLSTRFEEDLVDGHWLVYAATDDAETNRAVFSAGEARHIPVNSVDDREHCRFISPAVVNRDPVLVAISTGGNSPMLARAVRRWIEDLLPRGLGRAARAAGDLRKRLGRGMPLDELRRRWAFLFDRARLVRWSTHSRARITRQMEAAFHEAGAAPFKGMVYLVGAGPGRPELLTLRALEVLQQADVILHDRLVPEAVLDLARRDAELIDVGKRAGRHKGVQGRIHDLMVEWAQAGKTVVRLKGGDAFVFGRGGEELQHLRASGIGYEVVPGITAALGCAAYAAIPLTHRDLARKLTLMTGHNAGEEIAQLSLSVKNRSPSRDETLVVYMGVGRARQLRDQLVCQGMTSSTPVALVIDGTMASQEVLHGTVEELPALAAQVPSGAPGLFIIGEVAGLGAELAWYGESRTLSRAA